MNEAYAYLEQSRRRFLRIVALVFLIVVGLLTLVGAVLLVVAPNSGVTTFTVLTLLPALGAAATLVLLRQRPLWQALLPISIGLILADLAVPFVLPETAASAASSLAVPVLLLSLSGHRRITLGMAVVCTVAAVAIILAPSSRDSQATLGAALPFFTAQIAVSLILMVWLLADRFIASQDAALQIAQQRAVEAEAARAEVEAARAELERLQRAEQQRLLDLVQTLELPIIPVGQHVLAVPLVGDLDSRRAVSIQQRLLEEVAEQQAQVVVLDVTAISLLDTAVAQSLIQTAQAVRLLGARTLLSGIRPEVAQTLVGLDIDLGALQSVANLGEALELAR
jgi:rsbT co-antagonist protein RsbR